MTKPQDMPGNMPQGMAHAGERTEEQAGEQDGARPGRPRAQTGTGASLWLVALALVAGFSAGWWLHAARPPPAVAPLAAPPAPAPRAAAAPAGAAPSNVEIISEYRRAQAAAPAEVERHRLTLLERALALLEKEPVRAEALLDEYLAIEPYDPRALFLKARIAFAAGRHPQALSAALDIKDYAQDEVAESEIDELIEAAAAARDARLREAGRLDDLLFLYQMLTQRVPGVARNYYRLAEIQRLLGRPYEALASLNYVLYDQVWGPRAQELLQKIEQHIDLEDGVRVPLERDGDQFFVSALINNTGRLRLLIDTGASICVLRPEAARGVGLFDDGEDSLLIRSATGLVNTPAVVIDSVALEDAEARAVRASLLEMPPGFAGDGLLGMNYLGQFRFYLDQERGVLFLGARL